MLTSYQRQRGKIHSNFYRKLHSKIPSKSEQLSTPPPLNQCLYFRLTSYQVWFELISCFVWRLLTSDVLRNFSQPLLSKIFTRLRRLLTVWRVKSPPNKTNKRIRFSARENIDCKLYGIWATLDASLFRNLFVHGLFLGFLVDWYTR